MPNVEIEINPVKFITIGTVGPKGKRRFYLQAGDDRQHISLGIEKEQARVLAETINDMLKEIKERAEDRLITEEPDMNRLNMDLREPIDEQFRVARMGLAYDDEHDLIVLITQEAILLEEGQDETSVQPSGARFWATRSQMRALALHASGVVKQGRPDPAHNGRILYYWT